MPVAACGRDGAAGDRLKPVKINFSFLKNFFLMSTLPGLDAVDKLAQHLRPGASGFGSLVAFAHGFHDLDHADWTNVAGELAIGFATARGPLA